MAMDQNLAVPGVAHRKARIAIVMRRAPNRVALPCPMSIQCLGDLGSVHHRSPLARGVDARRWFFLDPLFRSPRSHASTSSGLVADAASILYPTRSPTLGIPPAQCLARHLNQDRDLA